MKLEFINVRIHLEKGFNDARIFKKFVRKSLNNETKENILFENFENMTWTKVQKDKNNSK